MNPKKAIRVTFMAYDKVREEFFPLDMEEELIKKKLRNLCETYVVIEIKEVEINK